MNDRLVAVVIEFESNSVGPNSGKSKPVESNWSGVNSVESVELKLFGKPKLRLGNQEITLPLNKHFWLLIYLVYKRDFVSRDELIRLFYPNEASFDKKGLRLLIYKIRKLQWIEHLETKGAWIRLTLATDVASFHQAVKQNDTKTAIDIYKNDLLSGLLPENLPQLEQWLELERQNLRKMWSEQALQLAGSLETENKIEQAADLLAQIHQRNPLAEDILQNYLRVARLTEQRDRALEAFAGFSKILRDEFGLEPLETTKQLVKSLREKTDYFVPRQQNVRRQIKEANHLIGRESELKLIENNDKSLILITGEPGIGKTSLLKTLPNAIWLRCIDGLGGVSYTPITNYLRTKIKYLQTLENYRDDLACLIPEIKPGFKSISIDPTIAKARLLQALTFALTNEGKSLVFDDLQWADESTLEFLIYLTRESNVKLFGTYRSNEVNPNLSRVLRGLDSKTTITIGLQPLNREQTAELSAQLLPYLPDGFTTWLYAKCGGNPFFIKQLTASMQESTTLIKTKKWTSDEIDSNLKMPNAISDLTKRRMSQLSEVGQRVLNVGSLMNADFTTFTLSVVTGLSEWSVAEALIEAENAGFIKNDRFAHDLMRQSIRDSVPFPLKKLIHANIAEKLTGKLSNEEIAEHWLAADHVDKACDLWFGIADKLRKNNLIDQNLQLLKRIEQYAPNQDRLFTAIIVQTLTFINLLQLERADQCISKIEDPVRIDNLYIKFAYWKTKIKLLSMVDREEEAFLYLKEAKAVLSNLNSQTSNQVTMNPLLSEFIRAGISGEEYFLLICNAEASQIIEILTPKLENIRSKLKDSPDELSLIRDFINLQAYVASAHAYLGDFSKAIALTENNLDKISHLKSKYNVHNVLFSLAVYLFRAGELDRAEKVAKQILATYQKDITLANTAKINRLLAALNSEKKLFDIALDYAQTALEVTDNIASTICTQYEVVIALYGLGKIKESRDMIEITIKTINSIKNTEVKADFCTLIYRYGDDKQLEFAEKMIVSLEISKISAISLHDLQKARNERLKLNPEV